MVAVAACFAVQRRVVVRDMWWLDVLITVVKIAVVIGGVLGLVSYVVLAERKVSAFIQERVGPNRVGLPFVGIGKSLALGQPLADALKFLLKEDFVPAHVNKFYFWLAPGLAVIPPLVTLSVIPFGSVLDLSWLAKWLTQTFALSGEFADALMRSLTNVPAVVADINVGLLLVFAITSLSVYGIVIAGWASNSKYPFLGGIRSSAQMISYELAMGLSVVPLLMLAGSLNLGDLIDYQRENGWFLLPIFAENFNWKSVLYAVPVAVSFAIFLVAAFAETNRLPFDLPESETELVGGYHTEYSSMKFALFFLGEYAAMIVASSLMVVLFLGGWSFPGIFGYGAMPDGTGNFWWGLANIGVFFVKMLVFILFFIWVRWTLPRFRYDHLMNLGWKVFLPLAVVNVMVTAVVIAFVG